MHLKKYLITLGAVFLGVLASTAAFAGLDSFKLRAITPNEFQKFIEVFAEMRGPLRTQILKDKDTNFESADPLLYVQKVKEEKDVKKILKKRGLEWSAFEDLMGNVLLGYFSVQEERTKVALIKQLASYGLLLQSDDIPQEYQAMIQQALKTDAGATVAAMALETFIQIPPENISLAKQNKLTLDKMFYTRFWKDKIN